MSLGFAILVTLSVTTIAGAGYFLLFYHPDEDTAKHILEENNITFTGLHWFFIEKYGHWWNVTFSNDIDYPDAPWNNSVCYYWVWMNTETETLRDQPHFMWRGTE